MNQAASLHQYRLGHKIMQEFNNKWLYNRIIINIHNHHIAL